MLRLYVLLFSFALSGALGISIKEGISPKRNFIGDYDGHSFFYDNTRRSKVAAKAYCDSKEMELAEILSSRTLKALQNHHALDSEFIKGTCYWLSGQDIMTGAQFVWENSGRKVDPYLDLDWFLFEGPYRCVAYSSDGLYGTSCGANCRVFCQT